MGSVKFEDFSIQAKNAMSEAVFQAVEESCGELESQTKRNTKVDTGKTKNSWTHNVKTAGTGITGTVGSPEENAIWEELGTGEYALNGNGRKGGWFYVDERGKGHYTHGKKPRRPLQHAYDTLKNKIINRIQEALKGGLS